MLSMLVSCSLLAQDGSGCSMGTRQRTAHPGGGGTVHTVDLGWLRYVQPSARDRVRAWAWTP